MTQPNEKDSQDEKKPETYTTVPTTQLDLETRRDAGYETVVRKTVNPNEVVNPYPVEDNDTSAYVGVDPIYMNYANETEAPLRGEDSVEDDVSKELNSGLAYSEVTKEERVQTVGTGSSEPHVLVTHSGEDVQHTVVDRKKVEDEGDKASRKALGQPAKEKTPAPLKRSEDVSGAVKEPEGPKAPAQPTPPTQ